MWYNLALVGPLLLRNETYKVSHNVAWEVYDIWNTYGPRVKLEVILNGRLYTLKHHKSLINR